MSIALRFGQVNETEKAKNVDGKWIELEMVENPSKMLNIFSNEIKSRCN